MKKHANPEMVKSDLRLIADIGIVHYGQTQTIRDAITLIELYERKIEDLEERIAIMSEDQYKSSEIRFP